jgi:hypothetical protein
MELVEALKSKKPFVIRAEGDRIEFVKPKNDIHFKLNELQGFVGGYIEIINLYLPIGWIMVCNEEGKLNGLEPNAAATSLYMLNYDRINIIFGDVLVCKSNLVI